MIAVSTKTGTAVTDLVFFLEIEAKQLKTFHWKKICNVQCACYEGSYSRIQGREQMIQSLKILH